MARLYSAATMAQPSTGTGAARLRLVPVLLRFISCGLLALALGLVWRLTLAPAAVGIASAFAGIFFLLLGFIIGGVAWYVRDLRLRTRRPDAMSDERMVFSFVVFAAMPFAVLVLVGLVWLLAFVIGAR